MDGVLPGVSGREESGREGQAEVWSQELGVEWSGCQFCLRILTLYAADEGVG